MEAGVERLDHGARSDEEFLGLGGGFMLRLGCGCLVPPREMEARIVKLCLEIAMMVEPYDRVRNRLAAARSI